MLIGEFIHTVDTKNRIAVPSRFRSELGERMVITRGLDMCLFVYPMRVWERMAEKLSAFPMGEANSRGFVRLLLAGATDADVDKQGRIVIPEYLRQYAEIRKRVVITGLFDRAEVWDEERWNAYKTKTEKDADSVAQKLGELGLF